MTALDVLASIAGNLIAAAVNGRAMIGLAAIAAVGFVLFRRLRGDGSDANVSYVAETDTGTTSVLISGTHFVMALLAIAAVALWPLVVRGNPLLWGTFLSLLGASYYVNKLERDEL